MADIALSTLADNGPAVTSVYPYVVISAGLLGLAHLIARRSSFYGALVASERRSARFHSIDGLRGFLALAVFFHHAVISYYFHQHGRWEVPPSAFYTLCGQVGVAFFFMITAFLFWTKGLGARGPLRTDLFFWSRITRLVPMYLASVVCVFMVAFVASGLRLHDSLHDLARQFVFWSSFGFADTPPINRLADSYEINSVYWSLRYEWLFYLVLPLGLVFVRGRGFLVLVLITAALIQIYSSRAVEWNFVGGAIAAVAVADLGESRGWKAMAADSAPVSALLLVLLIAFFNVFDSGYGLRQSAWLFVVFLFIAKGNTLFGLLTCRAARVLGSISYSVYLMHSVLLYLGLWLVERVVPIKGMAPGTYWCLVAVLAVVVVTVSAWTYRAIEHPFLRVDLPAWLRR